MNTAAWVWEDELATGFLQLLLESCLTRYGTGCFHGNVLGSASFPIKRQTLSWPQTTFNSGRRGGGRWETREASKCCQIWRMKKPRARGGGDGRHGPARRLESQRSLGVHALPTTNRAGRKLRNSLWISAQALRWHVGVITAPPDPVGSWARSATPARRWARNKTQPCNPPASHELTDLHLRQVGCLTGLSWLRPRAGAAYRNPHPDRVFQAANSRSTDNARRPPYSSILCPAP